MSHSYKHTKKGLSTHPSISINQPINHPPAVPHSWCVYVSTAIKAHLHTVAFYKQHYKYWKSQKEENPNHTGKEHLNPASSLKKGWDWLLNQYWLVLNKIEKWRTMGRGEDMSFLIIYAYSYTHWKYSKIGLSAACHLRWDDIWEILNSVWPVQLFSSHQKASAGVSGEWKWAILQDISFM